MIAGVRLFGAPQMGDVGEINLRRKSSQLLGVLDFYGFDLYVDVYSSNQPLF